MRRIITLTAMLAIAGTACTPGLMQHRVIRPASDDCPAGEVIRDSGEPIGCDVTAANTLTIVDVDEAWCDQHGGRFVPLAIAGACENVDH